MKNEEVQEIIEYAIEKAPFSKCRSGRLIHEKCVWFAIREAFNRGFERGEKRAFRIIQQEDSKVEKILNMNKGE